MIYFNIPPHIGEEEKYIAEAIASGKISGDGEFSRRANLLLENLTHSKKALLTTSCTHALEIVALLCEIKPGDEVIMPSYTFVSTANAFVLRGAKIKFIDIRPDTMNIDESLIETAITQKTKAIVPVHYAGVGCEMDEICGIAEKYNLFVVEDAAQAISAYYKDKPLGGIGDFGALSFHETKNVSCGEGGAILINKHSKYIERAEIIREKGTDRSKFFRGEIDKYSWVDIGSSYLPSELNAAYLVAQLEKIEEITKNRQETYQFYAECLKDLASKEKIEIPVIPKHCRHNAHMFWLKVRDIDERTALLSHLKDHGVYAVFHYIPLHTSQAGQKFGEFIGEDKFTTKESERLIRLPLYFNITKMDREKVVETIYNFFKKR